MNQAAGKQYGLEHVLPKQKANDIAVDRCLFHLMD
jgi:hypothetical protein